MAEDKKPLEKIKELIKNTDNIRNICTSAHIHHGKCVSGSTQLMLTNGDILTAKELFERSQKIGSKFKENDEELIYDVYNKKIEEELSFIYYFPSIILIFFIYKLNNEIKFGDRVI